MQHGARGRKTERARLNAVFDNIGHFGDILRRGGFIIGPALAHHIGTHRAMRNLRRDIQSARQLVQRVEIFGEGLPLPINAFGQSGARNILHALHQVDEPVMLIGLGGRKADAAIAHHGGGDAVPTRRAEIGVPRHLPVIMGVNIDPARCHKVAFGIDFGLGFFLDDTGFHDDAVFYGNIGGARRRARAVYQIGIANNQVKHGCLPKA